MASSSSTARREPLEDRLHLGVDFLINHEKEKNTMKKNQLFTESELAKLTELSKHLHEARKNAEKIITEARELIGFEQIEGRFDGQDGQEYEFHHSARSESGLLNLGIYCRMQFEINENIQKLNKQIKRKRETAEKLRAGELSNLVDPWSDRDDE